MAKAKHTPQEVWDLALSEVYDRISTDPSKIPPTVLSTLLATCQRVMEQQKEELSLAEVEPTDVFASLGSLPPDRAIQLLKSERKRLLDLVLEIDQRMESFHV